MDEVEEHTESVHCGGHVVPIPDGEDSMRLFHKGMDVTNLIESYSIMVVHGPDELTKFKISLLKKFHYDSQ